jgi:hypothetical protein
VTGFVGGTYNRFGRFYAVRQGDAHSWVEVYLDGSGWVLFDPTPPASAVPQVETAGLVALIRDVIEAAAQRWSRYVVGYDLEQQLRLLRWAATRYGDTSSKARIGPHSPMRIIAGVSGIALLLISAFYLWRRRRAAPPGKRGEAPERLAALQIVALYRSLEAAMAARGVPRVPSTPPLAHAQALEALNHPIAKEVLDLTERYVEVRYAGRALTEEDRREYTRRVRLLRQGGPGLGRAA